MRAWTAGVLSLLAAGWVSCDEPTCCAIPPPECLIGDDSMCEEYHTCVAYEAREESSQPGDEGICKMLCSAEKECAHPRFTCVADHQTKEFTCKMKCSAEQTCKPEFACVVETDAEEGICEVGCFSNRDCSALRPECAPPWYSETGLGECKYLKCTKDDDECPSGYFCMRTMGTCHPSAPSG